MKFRLMSNRFVGGGLAVFFALTVALVINLLGFQKTTRELAPAPYSLELSSSSKATSRQAKGEGVVVLNSKSIPSDPTTMEVQRELNSFGYQPGPIDGAATLMTRAAVMAFEYDNGLPLTAATDDAQLKRLLLGTGGARSTAAPDAGLPATAEAKAVMQSIQKWLKQLGYDSGTNDGSYSPETERAIRNLETDSNLPETGRVSGRLVEMLAVLANRSKLKLTQG